jgi:hypothetical protein
MNIVNKTSLLYFSFVIIKFFHKLAQKLVKPSNNFIFDLYKIFYIGKVHNTRIFSISINELQSSITKV